MSNVSALQELKKTLNLSVTISLEKAMRFFKTGSGEYAYGDQFIGVSVPALRTIAKNYKHLFLDDVQILLNSKINEERLLALIILTNQYKVGNKEQKQAIYNFYLLNKDCVNNWNLVDTSAHLIIGAHLYGKDLSLLKTLAVSEIMWHRRIAIVSTWYFIRKNDLEITFKIAELLLNDGHDLIHKAVGWMLREAGKKDNNKLRLFLEKYASVMPRTMLRYALEKFSKEERTLFLGYKKITKKVI